MDSEFSEFSKYCRICAEAPCALSSLFETHKKGIQLAEMISCCTQLKIASNDNRPPNICKKCIKNLSISYEFRQLAQESEEKFRQMVLSQEKEFKMESDDSMGGDIEFKEELFSFEDNTFTEHDQSESDDFKRLTAFIDPTAICVNQPKTDLKIEHAKPIKSSKRQSNKKVRKKKSTKKKSKWCFASKFECHKCKTELSTPSDLRSHLKEHVDATPNECNVCQMFFSNKNFERHLCKGKIIQCEYCSKEFTSMEQLTRHLENDHKNHLIMSKCGQPKCKKRFAMKLLLEWHVQLHSNRFMSFVCAICQSGFSRLSSYEAHMLLHTTPTSMKCKVFEFFSFYLKV